MVAITAKLKRSGTPPHVYGPAAVERLRLLTETREAVADLQSSLAQLPPDDAAMIRVAVESMTKLLPGLDSLIRDARAKVTS